MLPRSYKDERLNSKTQKFRCVCNDRNGLMESSTGTFGPAPIKGLTKEGLTMLKKRIKDHEGSVKKKKKKEEQYRE